VRKALARLADAGLVDSHRHGATHTWSANRDHLLWPAIEAAVNARTVLLDRIQHAVEQEDGLAAYLYGSFARRESSPDSDIDVLLVFPDDRDREHIIDVADRLGTSILTWTGNQGHINSVTRSEFADMVGRRDSIMTSLRADAVRVVGPEFGQLLLDSGADSRA
jgi:predicted nucleotidyltransferase